MRQFVLIDPKEMEGSPSQVAQRACEQVAGLARLIFKDLQGIETQALNAEMQRRLDAGLTPGAELWDDSVQGRTFAEIRESTAKLAADLERLAKIAGYAPK